jgi:hypothetical protein
MPFKANASCCRHIPKQRHRVRNWAEYDAGLRARGSLTVWFTPEAVERWRAITAALTLRAVFRLPLRQTGGLVGSIVQLLGVELAVPEPVRASAATIPPLADVPRSYGCRRCRPPRAEPWNCWSTVPT